MAKRKDEIGNKYGKLTVIGRAENRNSQACWNCKCDCGNECIVRGAKLRFGHTKTCGKHESINAVKLAVGLRVGSIQVIRRFGKCPTTKTWVWVCKCDCGNTGNIRAARITHAQRFQLGLTCGCGKGKTGPSWKGKSAKETLWGKYRISSRRREIEFSLSREEFFETACGACFYCGKPPRLWKPKNSTNGALLCNGIDRVDSAKGYVSGNCVPCCRQCNVAKLDYSQADFYRWIKRVHDHMLSKIVAA